MTDLTFEDIQAAREELRHRRHRFLFAWMRWPPVGALIVFVVWALVFDPLGVPAWPRPIFFLGLFLAWVFLLFFPAGRNLEAFVCPRCHGRFGTILGNLWKQRCQDCGLKLRGGGPSRRA